MDPTTLVSLSHALFLNAASTSNIVLVSMYSDKGSQREILTYACLDNKSVSFFALESVASHNSPMAAETVQMR